MERDFTCEHCGKAFRRYPSDVRKAASKGARIRFCSKPCEFAHRKADVSLVCPGCGVSFTRWHSAVAQALERGQRMYCSASCRDAANARERVHRVAVVCDACGATIQKIPANVTARNYCSYACMGEQVHTWTKHGGGKAGIRPDLGHFVRSRWEANICRVLRAIGIAYEYEPRTFRCGGTTYTPDLLIGGTWVEVKGWMSPKAARKIAAFRSSFPAEPLVIIGLAEYDAIRAEWAERLPAWES